MTSPQTEATAPSGRELALTWLAVVIVAALIALGAYWAGGAALDGFRSLGRP